MATTAEDIQKAAQKLRKAFERLEVIKQGGCQPAPLARKMKPTFKSETPTPDNDWSLNLEDCLLFERRDDTIPGGLWNMAHDALSYTERGPRLISPRTGTVVCLYLEAEAQEIASYFPAAQDLVDLCLEQAAYLSRQLDRREGTQEAPGLEVGRIVASAGELAPLVSAYTGKHIDRKRISYLGKSGKIREVIGDDGKRRYVLDDLLKEVG